MSKRGRVSERRRVSGIQDGVLSGSAVWWQHNCHSCRRGDGRGGVEGMIGVNGRWRMMGEGGGR